MRHIFFTALFFLIMGFNTYAQTRVTKETKVLVIVNEDNSKVLGMALFKKDDINKTVERYPQSKLYIGLLKGSYIIENGTLLPLEGATVVVYTERRFFQPEELFANETLMPGSFLDFGKTRVQVISNNNGELILKTKQKQ